MVTPKNQVRLKAQVEDAEAAITPHKLLPPSLGENAYGLGIHEMQAAYPLRYEIYRELCMPKRENAEIDPDRLRILAALNGLDKYLARHHKGEETTLRDPQVTVFEDIRAHLENGESSGYIKQPTGSGKTVEFSELAEAVGDAGLRTLIVVPTTLLIDQTKDKLEQFAGSLEVGRICAGEKREGKNVTIITYASYISKFKDGSLDFSQYDCHILDEAHEALGPEARKVVDEAKKHSIVLGFTATPKYDEERNLDKLLGTRIHSIDIKEAVELEMLAPINVIAAKTKVDLSKVEVSSEGTYSQAELEKALNTEMFTRSAVQLYDQMFKGKTAIAFCAGVDHAISVANAFNAAGIPADCISGRDSPEEQQAKIARLNSGEIKVLTNAQILIAGFDCAKASVCLNLAPTNSIVDAEQRGGRVLRLDPERPEKSAVIVDFIHSDDRRAASQITFVDIIGGARCPDPKLLGANDARSGTGKMEFPAVSIEGLEIVTDAQQVLDLVKGLHPHKLTPPDGWRSKSEVARALHITTGVLEHTALPFKNKHPDHTGHFYNGRTKPVEFYSPELVSYVNNELRKQAPENWMTVLQIARALNIPERTARTTAHDVSGSDKEISGKYYSPEAGHILAYYHPSIVSAISFSEHPAYIRAGKQAPNDWMSCYAISKSLGLSDHRIQGLVATLPTLDSNEFGEFYSQSGELKLTTFYSPKIVRAIEAEITKRRIPTRHHTLAAIPIANTGTSIFDANELIELFDIENPGKACRLEENDGKEVWYIHNKLLPLLLDWLSKHTKTKFISAKEISQSFGVPESEVKETAKAFSRQFSPGATKISDNEHSYSWALSQTIRREFRERQQPPDGWLSQNNCMLEIRKQIGGPLTEPMFQRHLTKLPSDLSHIFTNNSRRDTFFSPLIVSVLSDKITEERVAKAAKSEKRSMLSTK